jgi:hypothetical protein
MGQRAVWACKNGDGILFRVARIPEDRKNAFADLGGAGNASD